MDVNIRQIIESLTQFFRMHSIDHALIGAFALKAYGYLRATQDLDFMVRSEAQDRIIHFLESLGYETIHRSEGYSNHFHQLRNLGSIDFVYVQGDTAAAIFSEARPLLVFEDLTVPVVKPEHFIALKLFAVTNDPGRVDQDLSDIRHMLKLPELDHSEIRRYFEKFGRLEDYLEFTGENQTTSRS
jgi:hypothetical protein